MMISFLASIALIVLVPVISGMFPFVFAFKDQSMLQRYAEWAYWLKTILLSPKSLLFGSGIFQNSLFPATRMVIIDNMFLAVIIQVGIVGLMIILYVIYKVYSILVERYLYSKTPMAIACIALFTTWPIFAMFGTGLNVFPIYAVLPFLFRPDYVGDGKTSNYRLRFIQKTE